MTRRLEPRFGPHGQLAIHEPEDAPPLETEVAERLAAAFERGGAGELMLELGARYAARPLPATWVWLRHIAARYIDRARLVPEGEPLPEMPLPEVETAGWVAAPPAVIGADHIDAHALGVLWEALDAAFRAGVKGHGSVAALIAAYDPAWRGVGRVVFNLAENRKDPDYPFAFMATYTTRLTASGRPQHVPLGKALVEYAGQKAKAHLTALLEPVQRAAESCAWLATLVASREIFEPLRWTAYEAAALLADVPKLEGAGVLVRMPQQWGGQRPARPKVAAVVGSAPANGLGQDALLDFRIETTLDGEPLSDEEIAKLLSQSQGLVWLRGRWVEVDAAGLRRAEEKLQAMAGRLADGATFAQAAQLVANAELHGLEAPERAWSEVHAGPWLAERLRAWRSPERLEPALVTGLEGTLRPYQEVGVRWLDGLSSLGLGALLADDMGLGKTIQVIALLLLQVDRGLGRGLGPSLLVVPASLLGNWQKELARFAPSLKVAMAHGSGPLPDIAALEPRHFDVVLTTYGTVSRQPPLPWLGARPWSLVVADEAQALKNPGTRQTRALKAVPAVRRLAMTGTPVENRLGDLWSIFDFVNPGLLGSATVFGSWMKNAAKSGVENPWAPLRELIAPYVLRRKKTDKSIIADLPDKTEIDTYCHLTRRQAALYQEAVDELAQKLATLEGIQRRGLVLATLMRLKQICNHPSQWLGDGDWTLGESGKLVRLREIAETVVATQEKVLVFTQFREITDMLSRHLTAIFGAPGLTLTGETGVKARSQLVDRFQHDDSVPFFVLSLKAGGTGLNLTAASHVVHFDRWWNPAVEDQATDRAFRIGQKRNVLVHKLVCQGTIEERIAQLIQQKRALGKDVIEGGGEIALTELSDDALMDLIRLDIRSATGAGGEG